MQYNVDGRTMNLIKLMSYVKRGDVYTDLSPEEMALYDLINDVCSQVKVNGGDLGIDDYAKIKERYMHVKGSFYFADTLTEKHEAMYHYFDNITLDDILSYALRQTQLSNKLVFKDIIIKYTN